MTISDLVSGAIDYRVLDVGKAIFFVRFQETPYGEYRLFFLTVPGNTVLGASETRTEEKYLTTDMHCSDEETCAGSYF